MGTFYSEEELKALGLKRYGNNVLLSRNAIIYKPEELEIGDNVRIDDFTVLSGKIVFGNYIHVSHFCGLYGGSEGIYIDDYTGISSRVAIYATSNDYSGNSMNNPMVPAKFRPLDKNEPVHIGKHSLIGCTTVILPGVSIGVGVAIGAMTLVGKSLDPWGIYAGSPARLIRERSKKVLEFEEQLLKENEIQ